MTQPTQDELWRLLREAFDMPYGSAQIVLVEQIIARADAAELDELRFAARMLATSAYVHGGEPAKSFVTFSWCLGEYDRDPSRRTRSDDSLLLWHFKYMGSSLTRFPELPLDRTYAVIEDMERRYRAGGHSMHAVHTQRWRIAHHIGDTEAAERWYNLWCAAPRDANSDCGGCDPTSKVIHLVTTGRDEAAVALAEPVLAGQLTCVEQPQAILTELLLPYLRTGRHAEAADAHRRAYRALRGNLADLEAIAEHVLFCAVTGNHARGLEIVERHLGWLDRSPSPYATMMFASAAARLLDGLCARGHRDLTVRRPAAGDRPAAEVRAPDLASQLAAQARELAARFDARNGTPHQGAIVAGRLAAEAYVEHLPLSEVDRRRRAMVRRADGGDLSATDAGVSASGAPAAAGEAPVYPDDPAGLLDLAERLLRQHRTAEAVAAWRHFDETYPAAGLPPLLAARRIEGRALLDATENRHERAERDWREAAERYAAAGDEVRRQVALSRLGTLLCGTERYEAGIRMVEESTRYLIDGGDSERRIGAELRLAHALGLGQQPAPALAAAERAAAHAAAVPAGRLDPLLAAEVAVRRAQFLLTLGRADEAAEAARHACTHFTTAGDPPAAALAHLLLAHALADSAEYADAAASFEAALERTREADFVLAAQLGRGRALLADGAPGLAIDPLVEAVAGFVASGQDAPAAFARFDLANSYHLAGRPLDAAEVAEEAMPALERLGAQDAADRCRYLLSRVYRELEEPEQALALLDQLVTNLDGFDNLAGRAKMHEEAAHILYRQDRDSAAGQRFATAADGYRDANLPLDEVRARRWAAVSLRWAEEPDDALAMLAAAEERARELPQDEPATVWERAMLAFDAARVLIGADHAEDALVRAVSSAEGFRSIGAFGEALQADLLHGELLLRLDRLAEAEPLLRSVLQAAPEESNAQENGAWLLSEVLERLGRDDEADALRKEYGLEEA